MSLSASVQRTYQILPLENDYNTAAGTIYEGSALSDVGSTGPGVAGTNVAAPLTAGENFLGFSNDTQTLTASGTINVNVSGFVVLVVTGVTVASIGASVYASDDHTFTLTSTSNSLVGKVAKIISGTTVLVKFNGVGY